MLCLQYEEAVALYSSAVKLAATKEQEAVVFRWAAGPWWLPAGRQPGCLQGEASRARWISAAGRPPLPRHEGVWLAPCEVRAATCGCGGIPNPPLLTPPPTPHPLPPFALQQPQRHLRSLEPGAACQAGRCQREARPLW
jgi:hypothetical protein